MTVGLTYNLTCFNFIQIPNLDLEDDADMLEIWTGNYDLSQADMIISLTGQIAAQTIYSGNNYLTLRLITDDSNLQSTSLVITFTSGRFNEVCGF